MFDVEVGGAHETQPPHQTFDFRISNQSIRISTHTPGLQRQLIHILSPFPLLIIAVRAELYPYTALPIIHTPTVRSDYPNLPLNTDSVPYGPCLKPSHSIVVLAYLLFLLFKLATCYSAFFVPSLPPLCPLFVPSICKAVHLHLIAQ